MLAPLLAAAQLASGPSGAPPAPPALDAVGRGYVRLVLAIGQHAPDFVDAYFGPPALAEEAARAGRRPLSELAAEAARLEAAARAAAAATDDERGRRAYLVSQLGSARGYLRLLAGERLSFDDEARLVYGVAPPRRGPAHYERIAERIDRLVPGEGPLAARYEAYRRRLVIPPEKLEPVFRAAAAEARRRTLAHVALPEGERFTLELVTGKPWGGYNWYRGGGESLIQVNVDLPLHVDRIVDLAVHEGYPGHHVMNALRERRLVAERGWIEHAVYPLQSPISLVAEGAGNHAVDVAFPPAERLAFERDVLFPLAGLDPAEAARYAEITRALEDLSGATTEVARLLLDGAWSEQEAVAWLVRHALRTPEQAHKAVAFARRYRSYVVNYGLGEELVAAWVRREGGADAAGRWAAFVRLLELPSPADAVVPGT